MADTPPFGIRFKYRWPRPAAAAADRPRPEPGERDERGDHGDRGDRGAAVRHDRVPIYHHAVELAACAHAVIELAQAERFFLRDQLDRKSSLIPQLIAQGLAIAEMPARRALYRQARHALTDCATIFDMMIERGSAPPELLARARTLALALLEELLPLTVDPPKVW